MRFSFSSIVACLTCRRLANCTGCLKFFGIIRKFCRRLLLPKTHHNHFLANDKPDCIVLHHYDRGQLEKHGYSSNDTTNLTGHSIVADNGGKYQPMPGRVVFELARIDACGCLRNPRTMGSRITPISPTIILVRPTSFGSGLRWATATAAASTTVTATIFTAAFVVVVVVVAFSKEFTHLILKGCDNRLRFKCPRRYGTGWNWNERRGVGLCHHLDLLFHIFPLPSDPRMSDRCGVCYRNFITRSSFS